jgi:disulfide bond formation protein DsbB
MYLLMMAGVLAYLSGQRPAYSVVMYPVLAIFMIFLAFVGLMLSTKVNKVHDAYTKALDNIINDKLGSVTKYKGYMLVKSEISERWRKAHSVKNLYRLLYLGSMVMWLLLFAYFLYIGVVGYATDPP